MTMTKTSELVEKKLKNKKEKKKNQRKRKKYSFSVYDVILGRDDRVRERLR